MIDPHNSPPQAPAIFGSHAGRLAAAMSTGQPYLMQKPLPASIRLAAVIDHFRRRTDRMDHARRSLNALDLANAD